MRTIQLRTDRQASIVDTKVDLEYLQSCVGGYIEAVGLEFEGQGATMYLNEEGKLNGLPVNAVATVLAAGQIHRSDLIVGNVVLVGAPDENGDDTGLPSEFETFVRVAGGILREEPASMTDSPRND